MARNIKIDDETWQYIRDALEYEPKIILETFTKVAAKNGWRPKFDPTTGTIADLQPGAGTWIRCKGTIGGEMYEGRTYLYLGTGIGLAYRLDGRELFTVDDSDIVSVLKTPPKKPKVVFGAVRSSRHAFCATQEPNGVHIRAGCRDFIGFEAARVHWLGPDYRKPYLQTETKGVLNDLEAKCRKLGWFGKTKAKRKAKTKVKAKAKAKKKRTTRAR